MATYYVYSGATGLNNGTSWTDAYTAFGSAVTAASASGDIIKVHKTHTENVGAGTTYTFLADVRVVVVDKDASDVLAVMGTGGYIGNNASAFSVTLNGAFKVFIYGLTLRVEGGNASISLNSSDGGHFELEQFYSWIGSTNPGCRLNLGTNVNNYTKLIGATLRFGNASQSMVPSGYVEIYGGSISSAGTAPSTFIRNTTNKFVTADVPIEGMDLSFLGSGTLIGDFQNASGTFKFVNCKLGTNYVILATQTLTNKSSASAFLFDCASTDNNVNFAFADAFGTLVIDTSIYFTSGAAALSWKITTTANCSFYTPFISPWIDMYNATLSSLSPYIEILRDGSTTAYKDNEVWVEMAYKGTTGFPLSSFVNDRMTILGTAADQDAGAGLGSWTGEAASAWSGKLAPGAITPAENGHIRARIVVGVASSVVYVDPQIRT